TTTTRRWIGSHRPGARARAQETLVLLNPLVDRTRLVEGRRVCISCRRRVVLPPHHQSLGEPLPRVVEGRGEVRMALAGELRNDAARTGPAPRARVELVSEQCTGQLLTPPHDRTDHGLVQKLSDGDVVVHLRFVVTAGHQLRFDLLPELSLLGGPRLL